MPIIRETVPLEAAGISIGSASVVVGPVGITEVTLVLNNDSYTLTELVRAEGSEPGKNETVVTLVGSIQDMLGKPRYR
jgi:hypothetical protein